MSRGLGAGQRRFLRTLAVLDITHATPTMRHLWLLVWGVVDAAWCPELEARHIQVEQEREAANLARKAAWLEQEAADRELAAAGDEDAKARVRDWSRISALSGSFRRRSRGADYRLRRNNPSAEAMLNPSRVLAGLERRGLVIRDRGVVALTDTGAALARSMSQ